MFFLLRSKLLAYANIVDGIIEFLKSFVFDFGVIVVIGRLGDLSPAVFPIEEYTGGDSISTMSHRVEPLFFFFEVFFVLIFFFDIIRSLLPAGILIVFMVVLRIRPFFFIGFMHSAAFHWRQTWSKCHCTPLLAILLPLHSLLFFFLLLRSLLFFLIAITLIILELVLILQGVIVVIVIVVVVVNVVHIIVILLVLLTQLILFLILLYIFIIVIFFFVISLFPYIIYIFIIFLHILQFPLFAFRHLGNLSPKKRVCYFLKTFFRKKKNGRKNIQSNKRS
mmetsp:Transcript_33019/g.48473  ORF Transcript_33019/g.48473 Transcript_33019/m.48473 type:complete len:279 (+) Transcript_33019:810-1646(+)